MKKTTLLLFLFTSILQPTQAQTNDAAYIKTFEIVSDGSEFTRNIHRLGNSIEISFDDTRGIQSEFYYQITHCQIDWTPSNLPSSYYLNGFDNFQINNFENSFGTLQNYTHYQFSLPNENTNITKTGNYLIKILDEYDEVVCERRITLFEQKTTIDLNISESRDLKKFNEKQAVSLTLNTKNLKINFPTDEIKTFIFQNGDQNIRSPFLEPTFIQGPIYTYRPTDEMEFYAGNEFYYFDNNEILRNAGFVAKTYRLDNEFHSVLFPQKSRANAIYTYNPDINGSFTIRNHSSENTATEAEYSIVHFTLQNKPHLNSKDIYVYGSFNNFAFTEENRLKPNNNYLTTSIFLKQGFYNYDFVVYDGEKIDKKAISGSFFETENNYECLVYYQPLHSIYYQVVGYGLANSQLQREN